MYGFAAIWWLVSLAMWIAGIVFVYWFIRAFLRIAEVVEDIGRSARRIAEALEAREMG